MDSCKFRYHHMHQDRRLSCPSCGGRGTIIVTAERGKTLNQQPSTLRSTFRAFVVALVDFIKFKLGFTK